MTPLRMRAGLLLVAATLGIAAMPFASAQAPPAAAADPLDRPFGVGTPAEIPLRTKEIAPGFYMVTGRGANSLVVRTSAGVILVDTKLMYRRVYRELGAVMGKVAGSGRPVLAFVTHHHADHSGGNQFVVEDGVTLVGHENIGRILDEYTSVIAPVNPAKPTVTFATSFAREVGGVRVIARHWGPAHTDADIAVFFPDQRIVAAGDLVYGSGELALDIADGRGSLFGMLQRVDDLLALEFQLLVPGHGDNVMTRAEVELYRQRLATLIERGMNAVRAGVKPEGLRAAMRSDDLGFRLVGHFWADPRYLRPIHDELREAVAKRR